MFQYLNGVTLIGFLVFQKEVHERFVAVNTAYGILSKASEKRIYDLGLARDPVNGGDADFDRRHHRATYRFAFSFIPQTT
jgi:DnaJ-class molecular chaperone